MKTYIFSIIVSLIVSSITQAQEIYKLENGFLNVVCYNVSDVRQLASIDSIEALELHFNSRSVILLKSPIYLKEIRLWNKKEVVFLDSLPNLSIIRVEGNIRTLRELRCNPLEITSLGIAGSKAIDSTLLVRFKNVQSLSLVVQRENKNVFNVLKQFNVLKYLYIEKKNGWVDIDSTYMRQCSLITFKGNVRFNEANICALLGSTTLREITFLSPIIRSIPLCLKELTKSKIVIVKNYRLKGVSPSELSSSGVRWR